MNNFLTIENLWIEDWNLSGQGFPAIETSPDDKNLFFLIFPSSEISLTLFGATNFCGYHYWGHYRLFGLFGGLTPSPWAGSCRFR